ncbi:uncharacterized protein RCO7_15149 [Rhynchosporium graminicola]|uniref:BZIP domain-containing protein n=1 Tax=Rhynchosporium graminicola TaxID=2792576 RepID=A0A1E1LP90_9HELO|nr:uncharacterized protein RCO7_15149 [Rhynchosporium commune]
MDNHDQHPDYYQTPAQQSQSHSQSQSQSQSQGPYYPPSANSTHHPSFLQIYTQQPPPHHTQAHALYTPTYHSPSTTTTSLTCPSYPTYPPASTSTSTSPLTSPPSSDHDPEADLKRLRNTAASARFRAKKKQREQTLESQAREKKMALEKLEMRIRELETENRFLKGLIMGPGEKRGGRGREKGEGDEGDGDGGEGEGKGEELRRLKRERDEVRGSERDGERERNDGVGTD